MENTTLNAKPGEEEDAVFLGKKTSSSYKLWDNFSS